MCFCKTLVLKFCSLLLVHTYVVFCGKSKHGVYKICSEFVKHIKPIFNGPSFHFSMCFCKTFILLHVSFVHLKDCPENVWVRYFLVMTNSYSYAICWYYAIFWRRQCTPAVYTWPLKAGFWPQIRFAFLRWEGYGKEKTYLYTYWLNDEVTVFNSVE